MEIVARYLRIRAAGVSGTTLRTDRTLLGQFTGWLDGAALAEVTVEMVADYVVGLRDRGLSPHTVRRHRAALCGLWDWMVDEGLAARNVAAEVDAPRLTQRVVETLARGDFAELLAAAGEGRNGQRDRAILMVLLDAGVRASELCCLAVGDVDLCTGRMVVMGKGSKERRVYVQARTRAALQMYLDGERPPDCAAALFVTQGGGALTRHSLAGMLKRLEVRTGIHCNPHLFRHTCAVEHLRRGMSLPELQIMLGHARMETTRRYLTALGDEDVEAAALRTSPVEDWATGLGGAVARGAPVEAAVDWCAAHRAAATWAGVDGQGRVVVQVGGFLAAEGETLVEAVGEAMAWIERMME